MSDRLLAAAEALSAQIQPLLIGKGPQIQGAVLADLTAIWLAGHLVPGDRAATRRLRRELYKMHADAIWALVEQE